MYNARYHCVMATARIAPRNGAWHQFGRTTWPNHLKRLHSNRPGDPGDSEAGETTMNMRMAMILYRLSYVRQGHLVAVTHDDLVGQFIGHTAPKPKMSSSWRWRVLFIDETYYLSRQENERDNRQEAIEILFS